jgi:transposase InsO family protein
MGALCEAFGISRKTGYKWLERYRAAGPSGLEDRCRAPKRHGRRMAPEIAEAILALRRDRPHWGPRKLRAILERKHPDVVWPAASTMGELLRAHGLSKPRRCRRRLPGPPRRPFGAVEQPNDLWCIDFKGWFRTADGSRCDPLTVTDAYSRYVLVCEIVAPLHEPVQAALRAAFERYGLPKAIRSDNGPPFAANGPGGLTRLSLGWLKAGIALERIDPGKPQQNGRHERFHLTLKQETSRPPAATPSAQQARFDAFCRDYNHTRPHEALGQQPPACFWHPSPRRHPERLAEPWYDAHHAVRRVRSSGEIKWGGRSVFISETLAGEPVGIAETTDGDWLVRYAQIDLGIIDAKKHRLIRFVPPRSGRHQTDTPRTLSPIYPV